MSCRNATKFPGVTGLSCDGLGSYSSRMHRLALVLKNDLGASMSLRMMVGAREMACTLAQQSLEELRCCILVHRLDHIS